MPGLDRSERASRFARGATNDVQNPVIESMPPCLKVTLVLRVMEAEESSFPASLVLPEWHVEINSHFDGLGIANEEGSKGAS